MRKIGEECLQELVELIQKDNLKAHKVLEKNNVKWVSLPRGKEKARFQEASASVRKKTGRKILPRKTPRRSAQPPKRIQPLGVGPTAIVISAGSVLSGLTSLYYLPRTI